MIAYSTFVTAVVVLLTLFMHFWSGSPIKTSVVVLLIYLAPLASLYADYSLHVFINTGETAQVKKWSTISTLVFGLDVTLFMMAALLRVEDALVLVCCSLAGLVVTYGLLSLETAFVSSRNHGKKRS